MLRVRNTALLIGLGFAAATFASAGCTQTPPEIIAVDSGVNVIPDMVIPLTTAQVRFGNFVAGAAPVDLCVKGAADPDFRGPLLRTMAQRPGGVAYLGMGIRQGSTLSVAWVNRLRSWDSHFARPAAWPASSRAFV